MPDPAHIRRGFRHQVTQELVALGFSYREGQRVFTAMLEVMKAALLRHESVELPFGNLQVRRNMCYRRAWKLKRIAIYGRNPWKVVLVPKGRGNNGS